MKTMDAIGLCPECHAPLPGGPLSGLCPACLMDSSILDLEEAPTVSNPRELPGAIALPLRLGHYLLTEELARGGAAVVFRGRDEALHREVAVKILQAGPLASREAVRRLFLEARATARLHHRHILPVYEVGGAESQPYIVMPLLEGGTLAARIREGHFRSATPADIARLLLKITAAVHHAHRHGILHRDLKPGNILFDAVDEPLVGDFGLVRVLEEDSTLTLTQAVLGTPAYMSPEQARGDGAELTIATDVYGLGAILYELLAGQPPFTGKSLAEVLRKVQEEEAALPRKSPIPNPQFAIPNGPTNPQSIMPNPQSSIAEPERKLGIGDWGFSIGDLETICLKCLEKEPSRRYATAQALADDLELFLNDEPILARPVTRLERATRWCRRKPALASASLLILILLLLLILGSPIAAYHINEARRQAAQEADTARAMLAFLRDDLLSVADPFAGNTDRPRGRNLTLLAAVDLAARNVRQRFPDQPLVEAGLRVTLWQVYFALGNHDQAEEHIRRALELYDATPDVPELERLKALESMAWMHHARGRYVEAMALVEPVLERRTRLQGADHPDVLSAQRCRLAILTSSSRHPEAIAQGEDLLNRARQLPLEHTEVLLRIMGDVSWMAYQDGDFPPLSCAFGGSL